MRILIWLKYISFSFNFKKINNNKNKTINEITPNDPKENDKDISTNNKNEIN